MDHRIGAAGFRLLGELARGPGAPWLAENSVTFHARVRSRFGAVLGASAREIKSRGEALEGGPSTVFRVRRDPRFRATQGDLHPHVEGVLAPAGQRIGARGAVAVRLHGRGGELRAGSFLLGAEGRRALRRAFVAHEAELFGLLRELRMHRIALSSDTQLGRGPRGFEEWRNTPLAPLLRLQDPLATLKVGKRAWSDGSIVMRIADLAERTRAWREFTRRALAGCPRARAPARKEPHSRSTVP